MLKRITSLRAVAALAVFAYHLSSHNVFELPGASLGYTGVTFFFVLSGFVLAWGTSPSLPARRFYRRRFARIWPSYFATALIALIIPVVAVGRPARAILPNLLLVQAWASSDKTVYGLNGVSWSLSCEAFFYLLFPITVVALRRSPLRLQIVTCALALLAASVLDITAGLASEHEPIFRFPEFLIGAAIGVAFRDGWRPRIQPLAAFAIFAFGIAVSRLAPSPLPSEIMVLPSAAVILWAAARDLDKPGWLSARWLVYAGEASFAFYLVHEMVIINLQPYLSGIGCAVVALAGSIAGAALLHLVVERPLNRRLRDRGPSIALAELPAT